MDDARVGPSAPGFAGFVLNRARGALRRPDGAETVLRPKTFDLLEVLAARRGSVVSRDALLAAVWPDVTVGDESLTQCVGELRRALGPDHAVLLRTLPKRGYMLEDTAPAPVTPTAAPSKGRAAAVALVREAWALMDGEKESPTMWLAQRDLLRAATEADPDLPRAWSSLAMTPAKAVGDGRSLDPTGDLRAGREAAERALDLAPGDSDTWAALGALLRQDADRVEEALAAYETAVRLSPGAHAARANLGWMLVLLGRAEEGDAHIRASIAAASEHRFREVWDFMLGVIDLLLGRGDHGAAALGHIVGHRSAGIDIGRVTLMFAAALALDGRPAEAAHFVQEMRARDPGLTQARLAATPLWPTRSPVFLAQHARIIAALGRAGLP